MTKTLDVLIEEYSISHRNPKNIAIHKLCVPAIMWSLLGLFSVIKITDSVNAAHVFTFCAMLYYLQFKNVRLFVTMLVIASLIIWSLNFVSNPLYTSLGVFVVAWMAQFYGHSIEGKRPSFVKDMQFLLIGPLWTIHKISPSVLGIRN